MALLQEAVDGYRKSCLAHLNFISHASFLGLVLVEGAEFPPLPVLIKVTRLHHELVLGTVDGEAFPTTSVAECPCRVLVLPELVALGPVARVEDRIAASVIEASFVTANLSLLGEHPVLISSLVVTRPETHWFVKVLGFDGAVHTLPTPRVPNLSGRYSFPRDEELGVNVVEVPLEGLALETVPQLDPGADVAEVAEVVADALVVVLLEVVQPDLGEPDGVPPEDVDAAPPLVR